MLEKATRLKLRFDTPKGQITIEDLWDIPLTSSTGKPNLDAIACGLYEILKKGERVSFVNSAPTKDNDLTQLAFDIVRHVIEVRLAENEAAKKTRDRAEQKQQLLSLIAMKEGEQLAGLSLEELKKKVDELS